MLNPSDRTVLHQRLGRRLEAMMAAGFLDEVRRLRDRGDLTSGHSSMRAVGYRQLWSHLDGHYDLEEAMRRALAATRQLAKRQLTWMRAETRGEWLDPASEVSWNRDICNGLRALGL
jgi:tRNA dimethylallyltransferase